MIRGLTTNPALQADLARNEAGVQRCWCNCRWDWSWLARALAKAFGGRKIAPTDIDLVLGAGLHHLFCERKHQGQELPTGQRLLYHAVSLQPDCSVAVVCGPRLSVVDFQSCIAGQWLDFQPIDSDGFVRWVLDWAEVAAGLRFALDAHVGPELCPCECHEDWSWLFSQLTGVHVLPFGIEFVLERFGHILALQPRKPGERIWLPERTILQGLSQKPGFVTGILRGQPSCPEVIELCLQGQWQEEQAIDRAEFAELVCRWFRSPSLPLWRPR